MEKIITLYFYEVASRIIPGFIFIALYYNEEVEKAFHQFEKTSWVFISGVLLLSWITGMVFDSLLWGPYKALQLIANKICGGSCCCFPGEPEDSAKIYDHRDYIRLQTVKEHGEVVLCKTMFVVSIITLLNSPNGHFEYRWRSWYGVLGVIIFGSMTFISIINSRPKNSCTSNCPSKKTS